jgi:DNA modification methylase
MQIRDRVRELRRVRAGDLTPNPKNWRTHPKAQADALRGILAEVGYADALLARELPDGSLILVDCHLRAETTPDQEVPVLVLDINEAEADKLLLSLDPLAALAETNAVALDALLREVDTGSPELQQMYADLAEAAELYQDDKEVVEDEVPEPPVDPITKAGDLWTLGDHRLLCGDSTKAEDVERLMAGESPFAMITDPPYGVKLDQSWRDKALGDKAMGPGNRNVVANDDKADWTETWSFFGGDVAYVWHAGKFSDVVMASLRNAGFEICQQLIWNKSVMVMGRSDYHFKHEPCWYAVRKGRSHGWIGDRKQTTVIDAKSPNHIMSGSDEEKTDHPTQKPVECMAYVMRNHEGSVYDPFLGSGTTLIAAEQLGRKCYGMEISPAYCDVIVKRWETLTGKKATREGADGKTRTA